MGRDYRDGGRGHAGDPARRTDGARAPAAALLDHLVGETRDGCIVKAVRNASSLDRAQLLEPLFLAPDVPLVPHAVFQNALFLAAQSREEVRREQFQAEHVEVLSL